MEVKKFHSKSVIKKFRKQLLVGGGIFIIVILVLVYGSGSKEVIEEPKQKVDTQFNGVKNNTPSVAEVLQQHLTAFEQDQQKVNQQNALKIAELESANAMYKQSALDAESNANKINEKLAQLNNVKVAESSGIRKEKYKPQKMVIEDDINNDGDDNSNVSTNSAGVNVADSVTSTKQLVDNVPQKSIENNKTKDNDVATYIPSNSFVKGVLISALSANTGGNSSSTPTPILIRLTDFAQLPNSFKSNIKSCMVGATGYGNLSTERVETKLTTLSCVLKSGKSVDIPVNGFVAGEDAKTGIKGMVVTHSGTLAAKAALAGFIQGIGTVGQAMGQTQTITPLGGVTTTIAPDQALMAGAGAGVTQVGSTLSQYYLGMLQQISPSIEVSAGRHITVVFTQGVELKLPINQDVNVSNQPLPLNNQG